MYKLSTREIRKRISSNDLFRALLETSATLEELFFSQIVHEIGIYPDLISNWSLGRLLKWANGLHLIINGEKYYPILKDFLELRNMVVHSGEFMLEKLTQKQNAGIKSHLLKVCRYIDLAPVKDESVDMREKSDEHLVKTVTRKLEFLDKYDE